MLELPELLFEQLPSENFEDASIEAEREASSAKRTKGK
jgi:hypothetical protein